ncbi:MAG: AbrB/MazE/SpoVT family DNA-binding domain-containing protein [Thermoleophilia bacterium]
MDVSARISSKGQLTIPKAVREALGLEQGDDVVFRIADGRVELVRLPNLLELAGSVEPAASRRGVPLDAARRRAWGEHGRARR